MRPSQQPPNDCARAAEIDDTGVALAQHGHDLSQILYRRCPSLVDRGLRRRFDFALVELTRQEALDDGYLLALLLRKVQAIALPVKRDRFAALLDHSLQHALDLGFG